MLQCASCDADRDRSRSFFEARNERNADARSTGLHESFGDQTVMKAVSAMLTKCRSSLALYPVEFQAKCGQKNGAFGISSERVLSRQFRRPAGAHLRH